MAENSTLSKLTTSDLCELQGDARIKDLRLGEILEFSNPISIRKLIRKHEPKLLKYGFISRSEINHRGGRGAPGTEFWLNEGQAIRIVTLSETEKADDATKQIIDTFIAYRKRQIDTAAYQIETLQRDLKHFMDSITAIVDKRIEDALKSDPRRSLKDAVSAFECVVKAAVTDSKGRRPLVTKISNGISRHCMRKGIAFTIDDRNNHEVKVFPKLEAQEYMILEGNELCLKHLRRHGGENVIIMPVKDISELPLFKNRAS